MPDPGMVAPSFEEAAQACDCSFATAKIRIHRARKRLQNECTFYTDQDQVLRCDRKQADG
ncbi:hypothetical protein ACFL2T_01785 [Elusimicrobiota bacterium]